MAKKPGTYTSTIFALKSRALGTYLQARAWSYGDSTPDGYRIRSFRFVDNPVSVSKTEKSAKKLVDMIPAYVSSYIQEQEDRIAAEETQLLGNIAAYQRSWKIVTIKRIRDDIDRLNLMMSGPIDIVRIDSTTTITETIV